MKIKKIEINYIFVLKMTTYKKIRIYQNICMVLENSYFLLFLDGDLNTSIYF